LLILNPDVLPNSAFLRHMTAALHAVPDMALVTATLLLPNGRVNAQGNDVTYAGITTCRGLGDKKHRTGLHPVPAVSGAAFAVRRRDFQTLGGFDEQFFLYLEDTDLSLRAVLRGGSCWCAGDAVAMHDYRWRFSPGKQRELEKNRLQLLLKVFQRSTLLILSPGLILVEICTIGYALLRGPAYLRAKIGAYTQLVRGRRSLRRRRAQVQAERRVDDGVLLGRCTWRIPFQQQLGVIPGTALEWLLAPFFALPYAAARAGAALMAVVAKRVPPTAYPAPKQAQVGP
jgi:GT2 family glycosyltransferase